MANGEKTSVTLKFKPLNTSEVVAEIIIPNDGEENQDFSFRVYGKGLKEKPVICISNEKNESIGLSSTVDFGFVTVGTSYSSKFYVQNIGRKPLVLTGTTKIEISGSGADFFELTSVPGDTISAGGKSLLEITFSPNESLSEQSAIVSIDSNDPDNPTFTFIVKANGTKEYPVLELTYGQTSLPVDNSLLDFNDICSRIIIGKTYRAEITFKNTGKANLTLDSESISIVGANADNFSIETFPDRNGYILYMICNLPIRKNNKIIGIQRKFVEDWADVIMPTTSTVTTQTISRTAVQTYSYYTDGYVRVVNNYSRGFSLQNGTTMLYSTLDHGALASGADEVYQLAGTSDGRVFSTQTCCCC